MKRERIEDLGCIKILVDEALENDIFDLFRESPDHRAVVALNQLKTKLMQIQAYADGDV